MASKPKINSTPKSMPARLKPAAVKYSSLRVTGFGAAAGAAAAGFCGSGGLAAGAGSSAGKGGSGSASRAGAPSGASAGIGFAVPSDLARPVVEALIRGGRVERGWLGVSVADAEEQSRGRRGAVIMGVERNSPAARAGLRQGDLVTALNGEAVATSRALVRGVAVLPPGETVRLTLQRGGRQQEIAVQIGRRPSEG